VLELENSLGTQIHTRNQKKKENSSKIGRETNKKRREQGGNGNKQGNSSAKVGMETNKKQHSKG